MQDGVFTLQSSYNSEKLSFQITGKDFDLCPFFPSLEKGVAKNFTISGHTVKGQELCKLSADWTSEGEGIILNWNIFSHIPIEHMLCNGSIKNGILKGKTTKVVSPNLSMDARFVVNLVKNKISASLKGKVNQESFKTVLKGNLLNPEIIQQKK